MQFTGVQQQVATNTNLSQLIQLTQGSDVLQSSAMVGQQVQVTSNQIALQNGTGAIEFDTPASEPVTIQISDSSGNIIDSSTVTSNAGNNAWTWNGQSSSGASEPDGAYNIAVTTTDARRQQHRGAVHRRRHSDRGGEGDRRQRGQSRARWAERGYERGAVGGSSERELMACSELRLPRNSGAALTTRQNLPGR